MFDRNPNEMAAALSEMARQARVKSNYNQVDAKQRMAQWVSQDRRFDGYDPARLVDRVELCRSNGAVLDLEDPALARGGQPRPLDRSRW